MKKLIVLVLLMCAPLHCFAATYYVDSINGDDSQDGSTSIKAWKTMGNVNDAPIKPGDSILFKRGGVWRGQLKPRGGSFLGRINYGAYGDGEKPKLLGSVNANDGWSDLGKNIWQHTGFSVDVGNIIFDNEKSCGIKVSTERELNSQGKFWYDLKNRTLKIYSIGNPSDIYSSIECALNINYAVCEIADSSYVNINSLDIRYGGSHGIHSYNAHNIVISDCKVSFCGGGYQIDTIRYGNGIEINGNANNIVVEDNIVSDCYDSGITNQGDGNQTNIKILNNIVINCEYSYEFWNSGVGKIVSNILVVNNTFLNAGEGWGHLRAYKSGTHFMFFNTIALIKDFQFKNNILYEATEYSVRWQNASNVKDVISDYNCFYQTKGCYAWVGQTDKGVSYNWADYISDLGQDSNSIDQDPLLNVDFTLKSNSPCINKGIGLALITRDFVGTKRPQEGKVDIGAFERK